MANELQSIADGTVAGRFDNRFAGLVDAFRTNLLAHGDVGAACAIYQADRCLMDCWGGLADQANGRPWSADTVALTFSAVKGITATCINRLAEQGRLDIDLPVAHYWPEFAANGKEAITVRHVLSHQAGLAAVDGELTLEQVLAWHPVVEAIAAQAPNWEPGTAHGYHARSFGWILGEIVRRVTGASIGSYVAKEIAGPHDLNIWIGVPDDRLEQCAVLIPPAGGSASVAELLGADHLTVRVMTGPSGLFGYNEMWNRRELLQAEMPSSNGVCDARSLARFYAMLARPDGASPLLGRAQLSRACEVQARGPDHVIFHETCFGLGYSLQPMVAPGAGPRCFGHPGAGGSVGFADPDTGIGFAYVTNTMQFNPEGDPRGRSLIQALYAVTSD